VCASSQHLSDAHGTKTIYIRTASGNAIRHDATIADIAEALKTFGDTRGLQQRRADAVGIIADPLYTEELLTQARHHSHTTTPASETTTPIDPTPDTSAPALAEPILTSATGQGAVPTKRGGSLGNDLGPDRTSHRCLAADWASGWGEHGLDDEADRDAPHPSSSDLPDPLDIPWAGRVEPFDPTLRVDSGEDQPLDAAGWHALQARLAQIKHDAHSVPTTRGGGTSTGPARGRPRPGRTEIYVHLTDHTLATGTGVLRVENLGPLLADRLAELIGHGPYTVKPVIDLNDAVSADAYEIPDRIRERVRLTHPVEVFPYGTRETRPAMDLDHIQPYDPLGPPGQTTTGNLAPLGRFTHRVKTHARGWAVQRIDHKSLQWTTPHGFIFQVDPTGTHRVGQ
jgi:hypothetical protein